MPVELFGEDALEAAKIHWREDIYFLVRPVPATVQAKLAREFTRGLKAKQLGDQSADAQLTKALDVTQKRAAFALVDSVGFEFLSQSAGICAEVTEAGVPVTPGQVVSFDGKWCDALKAVVFRYLPKLAKWVSDESDKLTKDEAEAEAELGKI
jgi:hypothetical protein